MITLFGWTIFPVAIANLLVFLLIAITLNVWWLLSGKWSELKESFVSVVAVLFLVVTLLAVGLYSFYKPRSHYIASTISSADNQVKIVLTDTDYGGSHGACRLEKSVLLSCGGIHLLTFRQHPYIPFLYQKIDKPKELPCYSEFPYYCERVAEQPVVDGDHFTWYGHEYPL